MSRKEIWGNVAYYAVVLFIYWLTTRDGPPLRVAVLHHTYRVSQAVARTAGYIGLTAEHAYHKELERSRL